MDRHAVKRGTQARNGPVQTWLSGESKVRAIDYCLIVGLTQEQEENGRSMGHCPYRELGSFNVFRFGRKEVVAEGARNLPDKRCVLLGNGLDFEAILNVYVMPSHGRHWRDRCGLT